MVFQHLKRHGSLPESDHPRLRAMIGFAERHGPQGEEVFELLSWHTSRMIEQGQEITALEVWPESHLPGFV